MKADLFKLLEAQDIDLEIDRLHKSKKDYPEQISFLKNQIEDLSKSLVDLDTMINETKQSRSDIEDEIETEREMLSRKEKRLLETKTNKEYNAVQSEIEQGRKRIDMLETEELEFMSKIETLEPQKEDTRKRLEEISGENSVRIDALERSLGSVESDIRGLEVKRDAVLADVNKRLIAVYSRLRKGRNGLAITPVNKAKLSCSGCFKHLPPQRVMEIRRGKTLIACENCGRILVWDERSEIE